VTASAPIHAAHAERIVRSHPSRFIQEPSHGARGAASSGSIARLPREDLVKAVSISLAFASVGSAEINAPTLPTAGQSAPEDADWIAVNLAKQLIDPRS
jgi:hypothetical protein